MRLPEGINIDAIKAKSLLGVVKETPDWQIRFINRWYSKQFHTPLHIVANLPFEDILLAYWDEVYEAMEDPQIQEAIHEITETEEEAAARESDQSQKNMGDDKFLEFVQKKAVEAEEPKKDEPPVPDKLPPDVSVSFVDNSLLEEFGEMDNMPTKK